MKKNIKIDKVIDSEVAYQLNEDLVIDINEDMQLYLEVIEFDKDITLNLAPNIKVSLISVYDFNNNLKITYNLNDNTYLNEFSYNQQDHRNTIIDKEVNLVENANYELSSAYFSDSDIKLNVQVNLNGELAHARHNLAAISRENNSKIFDININNNKPHTYGELNNLGVVKNSAQLYFNGTGYIKNGAIQAQAYQESKIITFDPAVKAQANPYLIIDESDVQANHKAAVGRMDEQQLYYLQSRGLNSDEASKLITYGYLKPILDKVKDEKLKEHLENLIEEKVGL